MDHCRDTKSIQVIEGLTGHDLRKPCCSSEAPATRVSPRSRGFRPRHEGFAPVTRVSPPSRGFRKSDSASVLSESSPASTRPRQSRARLASAARGCHRARRLGPRSSILVVIDGVLEVRNKLLRSNPAPRAPLQHPRCHRRPTLVIHGSEGVVLAIDARTRGPPCGPGRNC